MAGSKLGYYTEDTGQNVYHYVMTNEPPLGQFILRDGAWVPLVDGFYLMDKIIDGDPEVSDPMVDPPKGIPRAPRG